MAEEVREEIYQAFHKMRAHDWVTAETLLLDGLKKCEEEKNQLQQALVLSTLGVLFKLKGEAGQAWRYYERAEKLLPDDPALKVIVSKLLIDQYAQYDTAIKKAKAILKLAKGSLPFEHQAHAILAIAYLKKGDRKKAVEMFDKAVEIDFTAIASAENLNFDLLEVFLSRQFETERCRRYVERALELARANKEEKTTQLLTRLLEGFEITLSGGASATT